MVSYIKSDLNINSVMDRLDARINYIESRLNKIKNLASNNNIEFKSLLAGHIKSNFLSNLNSSIINNIQPQYEYNILKDSRYLNYDTNKDSDFISEYLISGLNEVSSINAIKSLLNNNKVLQGKEILNEQILTEKVSNDQNINNLDAGIYSNISTDNINSNNDDENSNSNNIRGLESFSSKLISGIKDLNLFNGVINLTKRLGEEFGVDHNLINAIIKIESNFNPNAVSKAGAIGLMQLMPATAKGLGVLDPYDIYQNLCGGIKLIKQLIESFNGDLRLALAAYNAGLGKVKEYNDVPPIEETQNFVANVLSIYEEEKNKNTQV